MKYLFLVIGGGIFFNSLGAYRNIGTGFMGTMGGIMAIAVFLIVQGFEAKPIIMTNGAMSPIQALARVTAGKSTNIHICDPEELLDAAGWATFGYAVDFVAGLFVWPPIGTWDIFWDLIGIGGVTWGDVRWGNLMQIMACVFLLQICLKQYLIRGGRIPFSAKLGGPKHAKG